MVSRTRLNTASDIQPGQSGMENDCAWSGLDVSDDLINAQKVTFVFLVAALNCWLMFNLTFTAMNRI